MECSYRWLVDHVAAHAERLVARFDELPTERGPIALALHRHVSFVHETLTAFDASGLVYLRDCDERVERWDNDQQMPQFVGGERGHLHRIDRESDRTVRAETFRKLVDRCSANDCEVIAAYVTSSKSLVK
jgi:hypothetical protein